MIASNFRPPLLLLSLIFIAGQAHAQTYQFNELTLANSEFLSSLAINNRGQIVGNASFGPNADPVATVWDHTVGTTLNTPVPFQAVAINDRGQIAGNVGGMLGPFASAGSTARAALFDRRGLTVFDGIQPQAQGSQAVGINKFGKVVGYAQTTTPWEQYPTALTTHAAIFSVRGQTVDLGTLGGTNSFGYAINSSSSVVGLSTTAGDFGGVPTLWTKGGPSALNGSYPWSAYDINDAGQAVGSSFRDLTYLVPGSEPILVQTATMYKADGSAVFLDNNLNVFGASVAKAVNGSGMTVGYSVENINYNGPSHGMLWTGDAAVDLNSFLDASLVASGWYIKDANDINEAGWIVGDLANSLTGAQHGYVLSVGLDAVSAVPEPTTGAMLIAGGALIAWRRRSSHGASR